MFNEKLFLLHTSYFLIVNGLKIRFFSTEKVLNTYYSRVVISWSRWHAHAASLSPGLFSDVKSDQIVQHRLPVITTKHVNCIFVGHCCVFASSAIIK